MNRRQAPFAALCRQRGASLITAVFLITALAVLGVYLSRLMVTTSKETVNEYFSAQALYAAEAGIDWAAFGIAQNQADPVVAAATATAAAPRSVDTSSWFTTTTTAIATAGPETVYEIVSIGTAGGTSANPEVQRRLVVHFMP